jgi:hypothetical protein
MAKRRYISGFYRHPKTLQERKANQDKFDTKIRGKRRNLPNSWDDIQVQHQKSWKYLRREKQYRNNDDDYSWHEFQYDYWDGQKRDMMIRIINRLKMIGCYYEYIRGGIRWFGPEY